jgi:hypothetical protein
MSNLGPVLVVAQRMGDLCNECVFIGGAIVELMLTHPAPPQPRPTEDVDCVVEVATYGQYHALQERLRARGFSKD